MHNLCWHQGGYEVSEGTVTRKKLGNSIDDQGFGNISNMCVCKSVKNYFLCY